MNARLGASRRELVILARPPHTVGVVGHINGLGGHIAFFMSIAVSQFFEIAGSATVPRCRSQPSRARPRALETQHTFTQTASDKAKAPVSRSQQGQGWRWRDPSSRPPRPSVGAPPPHMTKATRADARWLCHGVEVAGIEPASDGAAPGLLRVQSA